FAPPPVPAVPGAADALPALRTLGKSIYDIGKTLRAADPASAFAFRLARTGTWLSVKQLPPSEGGKTKIPPPQAADTKKLQGFLEQQQWSALVASAEELAGRFLFWLDAHRFVAVGLERQGALFQDAQKVVVNALLAFVDEHPGVVGLSFADGTPFADEATKTWLDERRAAAGGGGGAGAAAGSARVDEEEVQLRERFEEARELVQGGKIGEGLGLAMQLARRGADARARFRARLETAVMALKGGKPELARPLLDGLVRDADQHGLEQWEPELCARLYESLLKSRQSGAKGAAAMPALGALSDSEAFDRLCRLDPGAALRLAGA
ncbi:MAG TPA: type VI secretion system domain-containing protein, partial [Polyangiaceae bacterium]|nr:type VI secretion system domain-containing protein [Polyangiaceae bacterium]